MKRAITIGLTAVVLLLAASCAKEICPGNGSYTYISLRKITHKSSRIKTRESLIHSHKPAGRKPPKRSY
ncbi:MAG: hypothetical protein ACOYXA_07660 [Bacteroidota bacterium]